MNLNLFDDGKNSLSHEPKAGNECWKYLPLDVMYIKYCLCLAALKELMTICDNHKVREPFCDMAILRRAPEWYYCSKEDP